MTSLARHFDLIDPSRVMILPDGSTRVATNPPHFLLTGALADSPTVSSSKDHAGARRVLHQAWLGVMSRPPTIPEIQAVQAIALHETGYGQLGFFPDSHNWGAVQCPGTWGATECPAGCVMGKDSMPPPGSSSETVTKPVCFRSYPDDVAGALDLVRNATTARPRTLKALATGDADQIAAAMYAERYYTGTSKIAAVNVATYAAAIARRATEIAKGLHEDVRVTRQGATSVLDGRGAVHLGTAVPLAALFGVIALRHHFGFAGEPLQGVAVGATETGDILPTFVTPDDARRYIRETDAQWERTDSDLRASTQVDAAFRASWATDLEGWRRFRDDAINSVGWLNTKATMEQTDRWASKLTGWRKALTDAGGKLTGPGPVPPGQGLGQGGTASAGWIQLALLVAALFGLGYLVRGFRA
jgi:hypothetical protein